PGAHRASPSLSPWTLGAHRLPNVITWSWTASGFAPMNPDFNLIPVVEHLHFGLLAHCGRSMPGPVFTVRIGIPAVEAN
ncbi:hypothetical protein CRG98_014449, partial [Punica granatum]